MIAKREKPDGHTCQRNLGIYRLNLTSVPSAHNFKSLLITVRFQNDSIKNKEDNHAAERLLS